MARIRGDCLPIYRGVISGGGALRPSPPGGRVIRRLNPWCGDWSTNCSGVRDYQARPRGGRQSTRIACQSGIRHTRAGCESLRLMDYGSELISERPPARPVGQALKPWSRRPKGLCLVQPPLIPECVTSPDGLFRCARVQARGDRNTGNWVTMTVMIGRAQQLPCSNPLETPKHPR